MTAIEDELAVRRLEISIELARRSFWEFCCLFAPDFYTEDRPHLRSICDNLQEFYESDDPILILCMPPRHGKSRTAGLFAQWILGKDPTKKVITISYNEELATTFAKSVRNAISEVKADAMTPVYSDVFPDTKVKQGSASMKLWGLEGARGEHSYLASSPGGTQTGFGQDVLLLDDVIKSQEEAYNERRLNQLWAYYTNTLLSRREPGMKTIIVMTRWATGDLAGRALDHYKAIGIPVRLVLYKARREDGTMLCPSILTAEDYDMLLRTQDKAIVNANYQQEPIDVQGRLYSGFRTYREVPAISRVLGYCDTADTGTDYLCSIIFGELASAPGDVAILDVIYTQEPMETTEPMVAAQIRRTYADLPVSAMQIESNNGGRGFARAVAELASGGPTTVGWFTQTKNKRARILTAAPWLAQHVLVPEAWADLWPDWWHHIVTFTADGHAEHDDAEDALTGVCEMMTTAPRQTVRAHAGTRPATARGYRPYRPMSRPLP